MYGVFENDLCPPTAPFFGYIGIVLAMVLSNAGAACGTAKAGHGILIMGVNSPDLVWRSLIPIIMAGVNGIYGLIISVIISSQIAAPQGGVNQYSLFTGFAHLAAGLCTGLSGLASGICIGAAGSAGVRSAGRLETESKKGYKQNHRDYRRMRQVKKTTNGKDKMFVSMVLIQVFSGNLALYGLITAVILTTTEYSCE